MEIEKAIRQEKFKSQIQKAVINIMYTANWLRDRQSGIFREAGILPQHYNVLRILKGRHPDPVSPGEIREVMLDKGIDLTRLVDKLVAMKIVNRCTCPSNRRKVDITLAPEGLNMLEKITPAIEKVNLELKENLSEEEGAELSRLLDKIRD